MTNCGGNDGPVVLFGPPAARGHGQPRRSLRVQVACRSATLPVHRTPWRLPAIAAGCEPSHILAPLPVALSRSVKRECTLSSCFPKRRYSALPWLSCHCRAKIKGKPPCATRAQHDPSHRCMGYPPHRGQRQAGHFPANLAFSVMAINAEEDAP